MTSPSRAEQSVAKGLRAVVGDLAIGETVRDPLPLDLVGTLEYYAEELAGERCEGWPNEDSLDGILVERASKSGEHCLEIRGSCIFISDQTECALWLSVTADAREDRIVAARCRLGVPDDETGELVRFAYGSREATRARALVADHAEDLPWMLEVDLNDGAISARSRSTQTCDECQSLYFADSSRMAALCAECAHQLYDY